MALPFPVTLSSELLYGFLMKQCSVLVTAQFQRTCASYLSSTSSSKPATPVEPDDERELELLQMDRLLKWMALVFDESFTPGTDPCDAGVTRRAYKQELFSIYRTLCSDYQQYRRWKQYNQSIWFLSSYRKQDTKGLARKILSDVRLFKEGLQLLMVMGAPKGGKEEVGGIQV